MLRHGSELFCVLRGSRNGLILTIIERRRILLILLIERKIIKG